MSSEDVQEAVRQQKMRQYVMDPTFPQPYSMDRVKFEKKIKENLEMNKNLKYTPEEERYWIRTRSAVCFFFIFIINK